MRQQESAAPRRITWSIVKRKLRDVLPYVFSLFVLLGFASYLYLNADRFRQLLDISLPSILLVAGLVLGSISVRGVINCLIYREIGASVTLIEGMSLSVISTVSNQLPLAGGQIAKAAYLKARHRVAYAHYASATVALYVCYTSSSGVIGIAVLTYQFLRGYGMPLLLMLGFAAMAVSISIFWLPLNFDYLPDKLRRRVRQLLQGWRILEGNVPLLAQLVGLQIALTVLAAGRLLITFQALSQDVNLAHCILFSAASTLTRLVSIAPGGLGVREGIVASVSSILGFDLGASAVAVGLERLISTPVNLLLSPLCTFILGREVTDRRSGPESNGGSEEAE